MNLRDLLKSFNVPFQEAGHRHVTNGFVGVNCPGCSLRGDSFKLGISLSYLFCTCWSCGPKNLFNVLLELTGASKQEIVKAIGGLDRVAEPKQWEHRGTLKLPSGVGPMLPAHRKYLRGRRFDPDEIERLWGVQGIGKTGGKPWRLFIPIRFRGEVVSWTTRSLSDRHEGRYWSAGPDQEAVPHKRVLGGWDYVKHSAIVVEGPADMWRIGPGAVCTFGTSFTQSQLLLLSGLVRVCIVYDAEKTAQRQANKIASTLAPVVSEVYVVSLSISDPGDAPDATVARLRARFLDE